MTTEPIDAALANDKDSVRQADADGRLHVAETNISKAVVNPYRGDEIPDFEKLGLDPNRVYKLYRHPDELKKAAKSFQRLPLLKQHEPTSAVDHPKDLVVGATGSNVQFKDPYLVADLAIWPQDDIEKVLADVKRELSSSYHYKADMTPGRTPSGESFDGVMREISGNHVALVHEGRAGPDVLVADGVNGFEGKNDGRSWIGKFKNAPVEDRRFANSIQEKFNNG